jgi:pantetheine-phosphate adenylyltransferase
MKKAVFPGSFDPFTKGHENVVAKALNLFDEIIIGIGENSRKSSFYTTESRKAHLQSIYSHNPKIKIETISALTVDFCKSKDIQFIVRGLRDVKDFEYERSIAQMNHALENSVETLFILTDPQFNHINASIVREIAKNGGIIDSFVTNSHLLVIA